MPLFSPSPPNTGERGWGCTSRPSCFHRHELKKSFSDSGKLSQHAIPAHLLPLSVTKLSPLLTLVRVFLDFYCPIG